MTGLPVDYSKAPWRPKYLTEETTILNYWIIFGKRENGNVDISDADQDIFVDVPRDIADEIIKARNEFCSVVEKYFCDFSKR